MSRSSVIKKLALIRKQSKPYYESLFGQPGANTKLNQSTDTLKDALNIDKIRMKSLKDDVLTRATDLKLAKNEKLVLNSKVIQDKDTRAILAKRPAVKKELRAITKDVYESKPKFIKLQVNFPDQLKLKKIPRALKTREERQAFKRDLNNRHFVPSPPVHIDAWGLMSNSLQKQIKIGQNMNDDRLFMRIATAFHFPKQAQDWISPMSSFRVNLVQAYDGELAEAHRRTKTGHIKLRLTEDAEFERRILNDYALCGNMSRRIFKKGACVFNAILLQCKDRIIKRNKKAEKVFRNHETLYEFITGNKPDGDYGITLNDCEPLFQKFNIKCRAIEEDKLVYRHDTNKEKGAILRLVIQDNHAYSVDPTRYDSFDTKFGGSDIQPVDIAPIDHAILGGNFRCSNVWHYPPKDIKPIDAVVNDARELIDLFEHGANPPTRVCAYDAHEIAENLYEHYGYKPGAIRCTGGHITSFSIRNGKHICRVEERRADDSWDPYDAEELRDLNDVSERMHELKTKVCRRAHISTYSEGAFKDLNQFYRGPVVGKFQKVPDVDLIEFDVKRAYTNHMREINQIPIFGKYDDFVKYDGHEIESLTRYIVRARIDKVMITKDYETMYGFSLMHLMSGVGGQGSPQIVGFMRPHRLADLDLSEDIHALYHDENVSDADRKTIPNVLYGSISKRRNTVQLGQILEEPKAGVFLKAFCPGTFLGVKRGECKLDEGFAYISNIILEKHRIYMSRMHKALTAANIPVFGIKTDALYCDYKNKEAGVKALKAAGFIMERSLEGGNDYSKIGSIRLTKTDSIHCPHSEIKCFTVDDHKEIIITEEKKPEYVYLESETHEGWDSNEIRDKMFGMTEPKGNFWEPDYDPEPKVKRTFIHSATPGGGKSYAALNENHEADSEVMIVCPFNRLRCDMQEAHPDMKMTTADGLFGNKVYDETDDAACDITKRRGMKLEGIKRIHFDELLLNSVSVLAQIERFMDEHDEFIYTATGDCYQHGGVETGFNPDIDGREYRKRIAFKLFNNHVMLKHCKRCKTKEDSERMYALCEDLRSGEFSPEEIIKKYGFATVKFCEMSNEDKKRKHVAFLRKTVDKVNSVCGGNQGPVVGDRYLGAPAHGSTGLRINSNVIYEIESLTADGYELRNQDGKTFNMKKEDFEMNMRPGHCCTSYSLQGLSLGASIMVHDTDKWLPCMEAYMYVAITRATSMDIKFCLGA